MFGQFGFGGAGFGAQFGGPGFGGQFGGSPALGGGWSGSGFGSAGQGFGGPGLGGHGPGNWHLRALAGAAGLLLDGPANAQELAQRVAAATGDAFTPPQDAIEMAIGLLAGRGVVTVADGTATLTDLGRNLLAWRGITGEGTRALLAQAAKFADVFKIRRDLFEVAGLARSIAFTGTEQQKEKLAAAKSQLQETLSAIKASLHGALAES